MLINAIENHINEALSAEGATLNLREVLSCVAEVQGQNPSDQELELATEFVLEYIQQVPYWMTVARAAAEEVGISDEMEQILTSAYAYWEDPDDVIPDHMGVLGILDDAYCSLSVLQAVSDQYRLQTGKHLFPGDSSQANRAIRQVIGEPYASELDRLAARSLNETPLTDALARLTELEKQQALALEKTIWGHHPVDRIGIEELLALGVEV